MQGTETLLSIDKARRLLGYEPAHSWRTEVQALTPSSILSSGFQIA